MKAPLLLAIGIVLGAAAGWYAGGKSSSGSAPASAGVESATKHAMRPTSGTTPALASSEEALPTRKPRPPRPPGAPVIETTDSTDPEKSEQFKKVMEHMQQQQRERRNHRIDERLAALKARLNLTPDQEAKIRALLENAGEKEAGLTGLLSDPPQLDLALGANPPGLDGADEKIAALLTPEQQEKFSTFQQEQRENRVEIATNQEMARLQQQLTLTPEQKDQVYQTLGELSRREDAQGASSFGDPKVMLEKRQARLDALRPILTPEQMKAYESAPMVSSGDMGNAIMIQSVEVKDGK